MLELVEVFPTVWKDTSVLYSTYLEIWK